MTIRTCGRHWILSLHGYCPRSFGSATEFHARAKPQEAVCLILDIQLDGESGIDLKRQLSHSASAPPVIFITGNDSDANRFAVQQVGCAAYLPKPFGSKLLLEPSKQPFALGNNLPDFQDCLTSCEPQLA